MTLGRVLVVAGSDSSGGAGLEADQKTIAAHGCYAMTATTALTAQNTMGVKAVHVVPAGFVRQQMEACIEDIGVDVIKAGMLATAEMIEMLAEMVVQHKVPLVVDPVMVSTSGAQLLAPEAVSQLAQRLFPHATMVTPNIPEAKLILARKDPASPGPEPALASVDELVDAARSIQALGPAWVLVKGGHMPVRRSDRRAATCDEERELVVDVLLGPGGGDGDGNVLILEHPWQQSTGTHGTGCSLASAIASGLAKGVDPVAAVRSACRFVEVGIRTAPKLGSGNGPLNHFHSTYVLPFSPGYFVEYLLGRPDVKTVWDEFLHHPFVMAMGNGTLPLSSFKGYLVQDYLYLIQFSRANALGAYKSDSMADIARATEILAHIAHETKLHISYCRSFGISLGEMEETEEQPACTAYTRYVLDVGQSQDWLALQVALAPCLLGYGAVAEMLSRHGETKREGNPYWPWVKNYVAADYVEAVRLGSELMEKHAVLQSPSRIEQLVKIFIHATKMEVGFWDMFPCQ